MNKEIILEVIRKLVGNIDPFEASHLDRKRLASLEELLRVVDGLVLEVLQVRMASLSASEWSREKVVPRIDTYFQRLVDELNEYGYCFKEEEE